MPGGRPRKNPTVEPIPAAPVDKELEGLTPEELRQLEEDAETEEWLADFRQRFSDQPVKIMVEKFVDSDWAICRKYPLATFDHEVVRTEFGGGKYRARLYDKNSKYIKGGSNAFFFADPMPRTDTAPPPPPQNPLDNPVVGMMMKSMESQASMLLGITQSIISANSSKQSGSLSEMVEAIKQMRELTPKGENPMSNFKETLNLMKLVKEVTGETGGGSEKGGLLSEIKEFLEVYPLLKDQIAGLRPGATAPASGGAPALAAPVVETKPMDALTQKIVSFVPQFVAAGKSALPHLPWAEHLVEIIDTELMPLMVPRFKEIYGPLVDDEDDVYDILIKYAKKPAERDKIYQQIPPLAPYKAWCNTVIDLAIKDLESEAQPVDVTAEPNGGAPDAAL